MKIYVRHGADELMFPSFRDFVSMYQLKFVSPDDLVRRENSERWVRAGDLPELRGMHLYETERRRVARLVQLAVWLLLGAFAVAVLVQLFTLRTR